MCIINYYINKTCINKYIKHLLTWKLKYLMLLIHVKRYNPLIYYMGSWYLLSENRGYSLKLVVKALMYFWGTMILIEHLPC